MQQSPAKLKRTKSLDFLRRIEPYQGLTLAPRAVFIGAPLPALKAATGNRPTCHSPRPQSGRSGIHKPHPLDLEATLDSRSNLPTGSRSGAAGNDSIAWKPGFESFLLVFVSGFSGPMGQVKGWRLFMIADAWRRLSDLLAGDPMSAKRDPASRKQTSPGAAEKDRAIDPMSGKNSPAREPEPVSSLGKRTGASPSCREYLTTPAF